MLVNLGVCQRVITVQIMKLMMTDTSRLNIESAVQTKPLFDQLCEPFMLWSGWLAICLFWLCSGVMAQTPSQTELVRLAPLNAGADAGFGGAVALSGDHALFGALSDNTGGLNSGSAFVFELDSTGMWVQVAKLIASDPSRGDWFGDSVALSGDRALIGSRGAGVAYVYERNAAGTWVEVAKLTPSNSVNNDRFGDSVAISGNLALVGASGVASNAPGAAYVYELDTAGTWVEKATLAALDVTENDNFGVSVAISGNRVIVGANGKNDDGSNSGAAYIYERNDAGVWIQVAKLTAFDADERDRFGSSVDINGDLALIGAPLNTHSNARDSTGSAYVFRRKANGIWAQDGKIRPSDSMVGDIFGGSVSISDDRALIGAGSRDEFGPATGAAYVFEREGARTWVEVAKFAASDPVPGDRFGGGLLADRSLVLLGDRALIGAPGNDTGAAYLFSVTTGNDADADGIADAIDNCPAELNPQQENFDGDMLGDACDPDDDNDGVNDIDDPFPRDPTRTLPPLVLDNIDSAEYGNRFEGNTSHRVVLERQFEASGSDLILALTGYDIDTNLEIRVSVNGTQIGFLSRTLDNSRGSSLLKIEQSLLNSAGNTLRFEQTTPGWIWGVTDLLLSANSETQPPIFDGQLVLDNVDTNEYGNRFDGSTTNPVVLERAFNASDSDLMLTVTGFDIDTNREIRVSVNGKQIGFLSRTPNNGRGPSQLTISRSLLKNRGSNTLRFEQTTPGWIWGVTDLLLGKQ